MEQELKNLIKVCFYAIISVSYCYYISTRIKAGVLRLLSILPVCVLFLLLPLFFSSLHFSESTAFFLTWLANFKLILFSFDKGPLYPLPQNLTRFIFFTCFPIKPQQSPKSHNEIPKWVFAIKVIIFGVLLHMYEYKQHLSPTMLLVLYSLHIYLELEIVLMLVKILVFITLGCDLEPHSNEPYLATSLQDFWGRRWNLMVPAILRPAVYNQVQQIAQRKMSSDQARFLAVLGTFIVSGAVHELIFFYITREMPTGEVTWFFVLHGVCTAAEVAVKKMAFVRRWKMSLMVSRLLTVGFVVLTSGWLFFPPLIRSGMFVRLPNEALLFIDFVKDKFITLGL
ncbi:putative long-chain-alcohol O-fatty-acyltransferase 4 [Raphanus sativus]|uniref:Probable long-chain-alcohol O-fatty-acyltransferase 4 n=1 Tax=Raphanus sativus TaxID=3726 RepID=A0A6J0MAT3_RAPSA|nr:probable long-chain-alcohol O-fatty-acyltransferase 4 [Raphanus sativus]KAJ4911272.1 putative long-chain-alcohol O-fatty-acyltransferase 4 [Raphanus sativus]